MHRNRTTLAIASVLALALALAACGDDSTDPAGDGDQSIDRTVEIDMVDIAFEPSQVEVGVGETVRFVFANRGEVAHDAFIGDAAAQADHATEMSDAHGGDHGAGADAITVEPGETAELVHTFDREDETLIGCHQPGHYDAGMVTTVDVR